MLRSLISQLFSKSEQAGQILISRFFSCDNGRRQLSLESLSQVLLQMMEQAKEVWIILDALDECSTKGGTSKEGLLSWMKELLNSEKRNVHLLVTSREEQDIESQIKEFAREEDMIPIKKSAVTDDIREYIRSRLKQDEGFRRWRNLPGVQDDIEARLIQNADGM